MKREFDIFKANKAGYLSNFSISLVDLGNAINNFTTVATDFHERLNKIDRKK
jgi:hypothetical protein